MKNYLRQIYYEMRHQKMMTWVSISGTALSIFLVMSLFMTEQVKTAEVAPESNRNRIMTGQGIHVTSSTDGDGSTMGLNPNFIKKVYGNLEGVEKISYLNVWNANRDVNVKGGDAYSMSPMSVDNEFWSIYDFRFIDGRPFDEAEVSSRGKVAVVTASAARTLFGEEKVAGREIDVDNMPYRIVGVVEDVNPLLSQTYANFYIPYLDEDTQSNYWGGSVVRLLLKEGVDVESVKAQVSHRYQALQREMDNESDRLIYHGQPYTAEEMALGNFGSNNGPEIDRHHNMMMIFYCVLIILPAINLSSMTRSRLRHRVAEIGVRRAFGAKRISIVGQMFGENLIITFIGGAIGLILSVAFIVLLAHLFFQYLVGFEPSSLLFVNARPTFNMMFNWQNFGMAMLFCFILNLLSATVPAWRASRVEPAVALSGNH